MFHLPTFALNLSPPCIILPFSRTPLLPYLSFLLISFSTFSYPPFPSPLLLSSFIFCSSHVPPTSFTLVTLPSSVSASLSRSCPPPHHFYLPSFSPPLHISLPPSLPSSPPVPPSRLLPAVKQGQRNEAVCPKKWQSARKISLTTTLAVATLGLCGQTTIIGRRTASSGQGEGERETGGGGRERRGCGDGRGSRDKGREGRGVKGKGRRGGE